MNTYVTDEEQAEKLKQWWSENGLQIVLGVAIGLAVIFGWRYWQDYRLQHRKAASATFYQLTRVVSANGDLKQAEPLARRLVDDYDDTAYAALGQLALARLQARNDRLADAEASIRWAAEHADQAEFRELANLRLVSVLNAEGKHEAALKLLEGDWPAAYTSLREEYRGDALAALGRTPEAREAYDKALLTAGAQAEFLRLKRDALGEAPTASPAGQGSGEGDG